MTRQYKLFIQDILDAINDIDAYSFCTKNVRGIFVVE